MTDPREMFDEARSRLRGAAPAVPRELLGEWRTPRRVLGVARAPRIETVGSAWRVGALLIGDDFIASVGEVVRSADPGRRGYTAESARARADVRAAALRGGVPAGESVHVGWAPLYLDELDTAAVAGPLRLVGGVPHIQWSSAGGLMPLAAYLDDRITLLIEGPA